MNEKLMQEVIIKCPSEIIGEDGLFYVAREVKTGGRRIDIVLRDRMGRYVLVEAQVGHLDTKHIDRHIDYCEGFIEKNPGETIRIMYIANMVNPYQKEFLHKRGYEFKEISQTKLNEIARNNSILGTSNHESSVTPFSISGTPNGIPIKNNKISGGARIGSSTELPFPTEMAVAMSAASLSPNSIGHLVARIREEYLVDQSFHTVRREAEAKAKEMLDTILQVVSPTDKHIRDFLGYMNTENIRGKTALTRFGRHFTNILAPHISGCPNTFKEWIGALWKAEENELPKALASFLANKPIKGADTLLPTFVLYLRKPSAYNIWTKNLENKLYKVFSVNITPRMSQYEQYLHFNSQLLDLLIMPYHLEPQEVDLVLSQLP